MVTYILLGRRARAFPVSPRALEPLIKTRQPQASQQVFTANPSAFPSGPHALTPVCLPGTRGRLSHLHNPKEGNRHPATAYVNGRHSSALRGDEEAAAQKRVAQPGPACDREAPRTPPNKTDLVDDGGSKFDAGMFFCLLVTKCYARQQDTGLVFYYKTEE